MSVHSNLVEGCGRATRAELLRYVEVSIGSLKECEAYPFFARAAKVIPDRRQRFLQSDLIVVRRTLLSFQNTLQRAVAAAEHAPRVEKRPGAAWGPTKSTTLVPPQTSFH